ncbi:MAG: restriction endonuclease [Chloroflexota bacterium]
MGGIWAWEWATLNPVPAAAAVVALLALAVWLVRRLRGGSSERVETLAGLLALSPSAFEHEVAALRGAIGFQGMRAVGGAGDLSVDVEGRDPTGRRVLVQCKRYAPDRRIGSPEIQQFYGMARFHDESARALFVTTSDFTDAARDVAAKTGVELVSGTELVALAVRVNRALGTTAARAPEPTGAGEPDA